MEAKFEELIEGFITGNIGISSTFLSLPLATALQQNLLRLQSAGQMTAAGIGKGPVKDASQKIRSDTTCWLQNNTENDAEKEFLDIVRQFTEHLNRSCYTGLNDCEFHYALYEEGTFYKRHTDRLRNDDNRKYSMISYLNTDWVESDGGALRIHQNDTSSTILPTNQKTVFFRSDELEHEVEQAHRPRMSITGWLKRI